MLTRNRAIVAALTGILISLIGSSLGWGIRRQLVCSFVAGLLLGVRNAITDKSKEK